MTTTITLRQTDSPSRSKMAGPCWIAIDGIYAASTPRTIEAEVGDTLTVQAKATLRRSSRSVTERDDWTIEVTGDPTDVVEVELGSPQAVRAEIVGARTA